MVAQPAYRKKLKALGRDEPLFEHNDALEEELFAIGSDRAIGVLFGSFLERSLERLVLANLRRDLSQSDKALLFNPDGSTGTFGNKIILAFAMNLIGHSTRHDLDLIRLIRNAFAHSLLPCNFLTPAVSEACTQLLIFTLPGLIVPPIKYVRLTASLEFDTPISEYNSRTRFIVACYCMMSRIAMKRDGFRAGDEVFPNDDPLP